MSPRTKRIRPESTNRTFFLHSSFILLSSATTFSSRDKEQFNQFDLLLRSEWDRAVAQGLFTFSIDFELQRRVLNFGDFNYILELNPNRNEKRRKPYPFIDVNTRFDREKFNFNRIKDEEVLFSLDTSNDVDQQHLVIINNAPIRHYHVLLVPNRQEERAQILSIDGILFGLRFIASSAHPYLIVGFNSLCAYASVNHLHLHGLYMPHRLYIQTVKTSIFHEKTRCYLLDFFPIDAFAFQVENVDQFETVAKYVFAICNYFTLNNIGHNMAIVKGESFDSSELDVLRIFVWFRQSVLDAKVFERCNFACVELSGYMVIQHETIFHQLKENELIDDLKNICLSSSKNIRDQIKHILDQLFDP